MCPHRRCVVSSNRAGEMTRFAIRRRFVSLALLWLFRLELIFTSIGNVDAQIETKKHYRTSDFGRRFLLAIPNRPKPYPSVVAKLTFMTYEYESLVALYSPQHQTKRDAKYSKTIFLTTNKKPFTLDLTSSYLIGNNGTGNAMKITADRDILVLATFCAENNIKDALVLPPTNSYASTYTVMLPLAPGFVLTLADHENTIVTFSFESTFTTPCDWNSTCGPGVYGPSSLVLNTTTYAYVSWGVMSKKRGARFQAMTDSRIISSSRPVLVIGGISELMTMTVMPRPSSFSKLIVFTLDCVRNEDFRCHDIIVCYGFPLINIRYSMTVYNHDGQTRKKDRKANEIIELFMIKIEFILSSVPIAFVIFRNDNARGMMTTMAPVGMWPSYIMFSNPDVNSGLSYIIHLIVHTDMKDGMLYNGRSIATSPWNRAKHYDIYPCERLNLVMNESAVTLMQLDPRHKFMAYITTVNVSITIDSPFGMIMNLGMTYPHPENITNYRCQPQNATMRAGDDVDNDCDDNIDEEIKNGKDDDGDGLIDEDIAENRTIGEWGAWLPWNCRGTCRSNEQGRLQRFRSCGNPPQRNKGGTCSGSNSERGNGSCEMQCSSIAESCALGNFGLTCEDECSPNCAMTFCEKDRGQCFACKPGYRQIPFCQYLVYTPIVRVNEKVNETVNEKVNENENRHSHYVVFKWLGVICLLMLIIILMARHAGHRRHSMQRVQKREPMLNIKSVSDKKMGHEGKHNKMEYEEKYNKMESEKQRNEMEYEKPQKKMEHEKQRKKMFDEKEMNRMSVRGVFQTLIELTGGTNNSIAKTTTSTRSTLELEDDFTEIDVEETML